MKHPAPTTYRLSRPDVLLHRRWHADDASVIYLSDARETHLLSPTCGYVLGILTQGPATSDTLLNSLQHFLDGATVTEVRDQLSQILEILLKIGLLEIHPEAA